ncbi:hypothetical protein [Rhizobium sp. SSA_523]|uniref:hypothetical protein n=1 Tax=Rhizobium sp. SSA_523 TaxID=2952477 RepID=UPI002091E3A5|nr:hypothetical protein [Rhizobium sp. SSA_523]MCO5734064.1 hypothetical protein [Rhizobium sp. SSA_523]WKC24702.1 hypothetical protein QTJ18_11770 [Rhizobium sp. SSA_523]
MRCSLRLLPLAFVFASLSLPAAAADPVAPVQQVMDMTKYNWEAVDAEWKYIFDSTPLASLFSKRFQAAYKEAAKHPAYETENNEPGDPFGYDVITNSQDGCPLQDVKITPGAVKDGIADVAVSFKMWTCIDEAEIKNSVSEVHFDVITEDGKPVIDDIHRVADGERDSVLSEMQALAKGQ